MKKLSVLAVAMIVAISSGCSKKDSEAHFSDAQKFIAKKNYPSAIIELKSAIQQSPENKDYRLALGQLYLSAGDVLSAEKELQRALALGADKEKLAVPLFKSMFFSRNHADILKTLDDESNLSAKTKSYLDLYRANVESENGNIDSAIAIFDRLVDQQDAPDVKLMAQANLLIAGEKITEAINLLATFDASSPIYPEAKLMHGQLLQQAKNYQAARDAFDTFLKLQPNYFPAQLMRAQSLVQLEKFDLAENELTALLKMYPQQPLVNYLLAVINYERKKYEPAKEYIETAINNGMTENSARILAALTSMNLGLTAQTIYHLDAAKAILPQIPDLENLYHSLLLKAGRSSEVQAQLQNKSAEALDHKLIAATAYQMIKEGSQSGAQDMIKLFEQKGVKDANSTTILASLKMGIAGMEAQGLQELEELLKQDPTQDQTRIILAQSYLRQGQFDKAIALADQWINKPETAVIGYNLKAYAAVLRKEPEGASEFIAQSLKLEPDNSFTQTLQALVLLETDKIEESANALQTVLEKNPTYMPALQQLFAVKLQQQKPQEAIDIAAELVASHPDNQNLRTALATMWFQQEKYQQAIDVIKASKYDKAGMPASHRQLLIEINAKLKNSAELLALTKTWRDEQPETIDANLAYAKALVFNKEYTQAQTVLDKLLQKNPANQVLLKTKVSLSIEMKDYKGALATLEKVNPLETEVAEVEFMKGRLYLQDKQLDKAQINLEKSYQKTANQQTAILLAEVYSKTKNNADVVTFLKQHIDKYPQQTSVRTVYAGLILADDPQSAQTIYKTVLSKEPSNYMALNNYAWLLLEEGQPEKAKIHIEQALKVAEKHPDLLDTYGKVLLALKQPGEAIKAFESSLAVRPENAEVQLHYVEALLQNNDKDKAADLLGKVQSDVPSLVKLKAQLQQQL
jgi:cellulose synthase operon protein C